MTDRPPFPAGTEAAEIARLLSYLVLLAVSVVLFVTATAIPTSPFEVLGAGAFPMLVHGVLIVLLLSAAAGSLRRLSRAGAGRFAAAAGEWVRSRRLVFVVFACLAAYLAAIPAVGYAIATFVFLMVLQLALGGLSRKSILIAPTVAVVFSFGLNWLFAEVFNVFLPRG